jgi:uridine kinase
MDGATMRLDRAIEAIRRAREHVPPRRCALIAVSGIDASGKGYLTARLAASLAARGVRAAVLGVDGWLNLPSVRFDPDRPGEAFYERGIRFDEMFARLVVPFRDGRSIDLVADHADETATAYRPHTYAFGDTDIILLEGVFLLKHAWRAHYDLSFWVDCSFETALERAVRRGQEGLPPEETVRAFRSIYFPAQRIHLAKDAPRAAANHILINDPRLAGGADVWD